MPDLKLIALDTEDLGVISAHLQDAVVRIGDLVYDPSARRFAAVVNRFDWETAAKRRLIKTFERRRAGLRFEKAGAVRSRGIDRGKPDEVLALLAVSFTETEAPSGTIALNFSGGGVIEIDVECIEAELRDLGAAWTTVRKPRHPTTGEGA